MQLPKHAMQTISDDGIFYFHLIRERENCIFSASIPDGIPRGNRHTGKNKCAFFDCSVEGFGIYFPFKTTSHLYIFKMYKMLEKALCEQ